MIEQPDDLWYLYNVLKVGDRLTARTQRKVKHESSNGELKSVSVKTMRLTIEISKIDYTPNDAEIRVNGKCLSDLEEISLGQYHTIEICNESQLRLEKDNWDYVDRRFLRDACDPGGSADVAFLLMDLSKAVLYVLAGPLIKHVGSTTGKVVKANAVNVAFGKIDKARTSFYQRICELVIMKLDLTKLKCLVLGGATPVYGEFMQWIRNDNNLNLPPSVQSRSSHTSGTGKGGPKIPPEERLKKIRSMMLAGRSTSTLGEDSITGLLNDRNVSERLAQLRVATDFKLLQRWHTMHNAADGDLMTPYGISGVYAAAQAGAIECLIISDKLLKSPCLKERSYFSHLATQLEATKANVIMVSSSGLAAADIEKLANVAAILRYPLHELRDLELSSIPRELRE